MHRHLARLRNSCRDCRLSLRERRQLLLRQSLSERGGVIRLRYFFFSAFVSPISTRRWALSFLSLETG